MTLHNYICPFTVLLIKMSIYVKSFFISTCFLKILKYVYFVLMNLKKQKYELILKFPPILLVSLLHFEYTCMVSAILEYSSMEYIYFRLFFFIKLYIYSCNISIYTDCQIQILATQIQNKYIFIFKGLYYISRMFMTIVDFISVWFRCCHNIQYIYTILQYYLYNRSEWQKNFHFYCSICMPEIYY